MVHRYDLFKCRARRTWQDNLFGVYLEYNHGIYLCKTLATAINQATFIFWHERLPRRCFDNNKSLLFFFRSMRHSNAHTRSLYTLREIQFRYACVSKLRTDSNYRCFFLDGGRSRIYYYRSIIRVGYEKN